MRRNNNIITNTNEEVEVLDGKVRARGDVLIIVVLWVLASNLFNASSKQVSTSNPWTAFVTTTTQLFGTSLLGISMMLAQGQNFASFISPFKKAIPIGIGLAIANGSMMWALSRTSIGMFQTVKASSPLFTALACYVVLGRRYTIQTYLTLIPVMLGLASASATDLQADVFGLTACIVSSLCQVFVNLSAKQLLEISYPDLDVATIGTGKVRILKPYELQSMVSIVGFLVCFTALIIIIVGSMANQYYLQDPSANQKSFELTLDHLFPPFGLLFWNVILYSLENVLAYAANGKLARLPFAVVDAVRRLTIVISFNVILSERVPESMNLVGVLAVAVGSVCFAIVVEER